MTPRTFRLVMVVLLAAIAVVVVGCGAWVLWIEVPG